MSSGILPFEIVALIIDIVEENKDTNLLKELALVSHSFLQICSKHLFATVELNDYAVPIHRASSIKKGFINLLKSRPDVAKHIRKLTYRVVSNCSVSTPSTDDLLSPILPNSLRTISGLKCLEINASRSDWNKLNSSWTSAFLHLMHLPTINHIDLSFIHNFPLSSFTPAVNLLRLDVNYVYPFEEGISPDFVVQSEMMPKIREFHTSESSLLTKKLLHAKRQDGRPACNFTDLRQFSISAHSSEDEENIQYLLQNIKFLEKLDLQLSHGWSLMGLPSHDILSSCARTLKVLDLTVFSNHRSVSLELARLCEGIKAMAGHNMLEAVSLKVRTKPDFLSFNIHAGGHEEEDCISSLIQELGKVLGTVRCSPGLVCVKGLGKFL